MILAEYNNNTYEVVKLFRKYNLITHNESKTTAEFKKGNELYYKVIDEMTQLKSVYRLGVYVIYNSGFENAPNEWCTNTWNKVYKDYVELEYWHGHLNGWKITDRNCCVKDINFDEIDSIWILVEKIVGTIDNSDNSIDELRKLKHTYICDTYKGPISKLVLTEDKSYKYEISKYKINENELNSIMNKLINI